MQVVAKMYKDNEYYASDRYGSAADRKEDQKQKKHHDQRKRKDPELYCSTGALQSFPVNDWLREHKPAYRAEYLFGDLWRPGAVETACYWHDNKTPDGDGVIAAAAAVRLASEAYDLAFIYLGHTDSAGHALSGG